MGDLFTDQLSQEEKWAIEIQDCRDRVESRVMEALALGRAKTKRKELYKSWRTQYGDDIAKESAKLVEAIIKGDLEIPKWFRIRRRNK
jgi:hypothetical protein